MTLLIYFLRLTIFKRVTSLMQLRLSYGKSAVLNLGGLFRLTNGRLCMICDVFSALGDLVVGCVDSIRRYQ